MNLGFILRLLLVATTAAVCLAAIDDLSEDKYWDKNEDDISSSEESQDFAFDDKKNSESFKHINDWWSRDELCKDVKCKPNEYCVVKSKGFAYCVKRKPNYNDVNYFDDDKQSKSKANGKRNEKKIISDNDDEDDDYDDEDSDQMSEESKLKLCTPCPVVKPQFICGTDNSTYSSLCRLDFHNCVHKTHVEMACKGFCPCVRKLKSDVNEIKGKKHDNNNDKKQFQNKLKHEKNYKVKDEFNNKAKYHKKANFGKHSEHKQNMHNSVLQSFDAKPLNSKKCSQKDLKVMGTRLLDWFSVVIAEQQKKNRTQSKKNNALKLMDCQPEVSWMFRHFDTNSDLRLSLKELYYLEHDENEHCLQPYISSCDEDGDTYLSAYEWCTCFDTKSEPCTLALHRSKKGLLGAYRPQCDSDGFYRPLQCHSSTAICWCVDKNGVEFLNSRRKGNPDCKMLFNHSHQRNKFEDTDDDDDDDDGDIENGSGDGIVNE